MDALCSFEALVKKITFFGRERNLKSSDLSVRVTLCDKVDLLIRGEDVAPTLDCGCSDEPNSCNASVDVNAGKSIIFSARKGDFGRAACARPIVVEVLDVRGGRYESSDVEANAESIERVINADPGDATGPKRYESDGTVNLLNGETEIGTVELNVRLRNFGTQVCTAFRTSGSAEGETKVYFKNSESDHTFQIQPIGATRRAPPLPVLNAPRSVVGGREAGCENGTRAAAPERRVLVVYTGGTIGMIRNDEGVLAPVPNALMKKIRTYPALYDAEYALEKYGPSYLTNDELVLPCCEEACRVIYTIIEYEPLLDSSNMGLDEWIRIARDIEKHYKDFDGFVVLHGTDTLTYTASALSFMFENLGKSVVLTGAQVPIFEIRSDGKDNFLSSLIFAGGYVVPEVTICFDSALYRGNRTVKISADNFKAFASPNLAPLATVGIKIEVNHGSIFRPDAIEKFQVHAKLNQNVVLLRLFPSITVTIIRQFLREPTEGCVLQSYGAGNVPSNRKDLLAVFEQATDRGVIIVNCTQCMEGTVEEIYETGSILKRVGIVSGLDMTAEAALTKLSYVLSKTEWSLEKKREMMGKNIRGELTSDQLRDVDKDELVGAVAARLKLTSPADVDRLGRVLCPALSIAAAAEGDVGKLKRLRSAGVDLCQSDVEKRTPLHVACSSGEVDAVRYLLSSGCSVHARDKDEDTPLREAVKHDRHEVIEILLQCGAHFGDTCAHITGDEICLAAAAGRLKRLKSYRLAGVSLRTTDLSGRTALHLATLRGHVDVVRFLLAEGCSPNDKDAVGVTPKEIAERTANDEMMNLFEDRS